MAKYVNEDLDPTRVMRIVDHPVRMKIIELLATRGPMSWKDLSVELGTGTGSLYHHLDTLEKIVARLIAAGLSPETPAAVVAAATLPEERVIVAPLCELSRLARQAHIQAPAVRATAVAIVHGTAGVFGSRTYRLSASARSRGPNGPS